jgi:D-psicose/D-tagatose/L-ribulose 3-epimerase
MKVGISAFAWTSNFDTSHLALLPLIKKLGLGGAEVPMFDPAKLPVREIRHEFLNNGLECTACAILPVAYNPISPNRSTRRNAIDHLTRCVEATAAMGSKLLAGPLYAPIGYLPPHRPTADEWSWAAETFQALIHILESYDVMLAIEPVNRSETFFLRTAQDTKRLCEIVNDPRVGATLDTFHANIEERSIPTATHCLGKHLKHVHISENDRGPLGEGHVPFVQIATALKAVKYDGYLMIEGFGYSSQDKSAPGYLWAPSDVSPEYFAAESVRHLYGVLEAASE